MKLIRSRSPKIEIEDDSDAARLKQDIPHQKIPVKKTRKVAENDAYQQDKEKQKEGSEPIQEEETKRLAQQRRFRTIFFCWAIASLTIVISASLIFFGWHVWATDGKPNPQIAIAWLSSTVVQVLGLGHVIARYLFGQSKQDQK